MGYPSKIKKDELVRLYNEGLSYTELAKHFDVHPITMSRALTKYGLKDRPLQRRMTPERKARIQQLIDDGWSWIEIQNTEGAHWETLKRHFPGTQWTKGQRIEHTRTVCYFNDAIRHANYARQAA